MKTKKTTIHLKPLISDIWAYRNSFILYQVIAQGITGLLLLPAMSLCLNWLMIKSGNGAITNGLITKFFLSPYGIISFFVGLIFAIFIILIELGGLILLSANVHQHRKISFKTIITVSLKRFKNLIGVGGLLVLFLFFIVAPWFDIGINTSAISNLRIPGFVLDHIRNSRILDLLLIAFTGVLICMALFMMFALHHIMLNNKSSKEAIKLSVKTVKKHFGFIIKSFVKVVLIMLGIFLIVLLLLGGSTLLFFTIPNIPDEVRQILLASTYIIFYVVIQMAILPFNIQILTNLYYDLHPVIESDALSQEAFQPKQMTPKSWFFVIGASVVILLLTGLITIGLVDMANDIRYDIDITAHRGSSMEAPENTIAGLKIAIKNKADFSEIDVQLTKDEEVVLIHDTNLKRTTGVDQDIYDLTLAEVQELDAGSWFSEEFAGEKIPTLEEAILATKKKIRLNIELKAHDMSANLVPKVVELIEKHGLVQNCVVTSLDYELLQEVEKLNPYIRTGYVMFLALGNLENLRTDFYSIEVSNVSEKFVATAHRLGREVHVWTVNDSDELTTLAEYGVDNIITDYELEMKQSLEYLAKEEMVFEKIINLLFE